MKFIALLLILGLWSCAGPQDPPVPTLDDFERERLNSIYVACINHMITRMGPPPAAIAGRKPRIFVGVFPPPQSRLGKLELLDPAESVLARTQRPGIEVKAASRAKGCNLSWGYCFDDADDGGWKLIMLGVNLKSANEAAAGISAGPVSYSASLEFREGTWTVTHWERTGEY